MSRQAHTTDRLAELISNKHQVLVQLHDIGRRQLEIIERDQVAELLKLLAAKQHLITALQAVEAELAPFRQQDPESRTWSSTDRRAQCKSLADECNRLLGEVMQLEKESEMKMTERRNIVASQLQEVHAAGKARGAYAAHQAHRPTTVAPNVDLGSPPIDMSKAGLDLVSDT